MLVPRTSTVRFVEAVRPLPKGFCVEDVTISGTMTWNVFGDQACVLRCVRQKVAVARLNARDTCKRVHVLGPARGRAGQSTFLLSSRPV